MRSLTSFLRSSSLKCKQQTITVLSTIMNSFLRVIFFQGGDGRRKKKPFSVVENFNPFWWHPVTQKLIGKAKQNRPDKRQSKKFLRKHCQWKQNIKPWLASLSCDSSRVPTVRFAISAFGASNGWIISMFTWPEAMKINLLEQKKMLGQTKQLLEDWFRKPTWKPFHHGFWPPIYLTAVTSCENTVYVVLLRSHEASEKPRIRTSLLHSEQCSAARPPFHDLTPFQRVGS